MEKSTVAEKYTSLRLMLGIQKLAGLAAGLVLLIVGVSSSSMSTTFLMGAAAVVVVVAVFAFVQTVEIFVDIEHTLREIKEKIK